MSDNGCYFIKCPYWNGKICTDTDEFFNKSGDMVCRFNGDAVRKTEVEKLRDEVAALRAELAEKEAELAELREQNKVLREEENVPYLRELKASAKLRECLNKSWEREDKMSDDVLKYFIENSELRERMKPVEEVYKKSDPSAWDMWQAIKAACEGK